MDCIYSSHTLEHLWRQDGENLMRECHCVLKPGGVLRVVVPDLRFCVDAYLAAEIPCERFLESLLAIDGKHASFGHRLLGVIDDGPVHKCMYDTRGLIRMLQAAGFTATSVPKHESKIPNIERIEEHDRTLNAVIVEGVKS